MPKTVDMEEVFLKAWLHWAQKATDKKECKKGSWSKDCSFCKYNNPLRHYHNDCNHCPALGLWHGVKGTCEGSKGEWSIWNNSSTLHNATKILKVVEAAYLRWKSGEWKPQV